MRFCGAIIPRQVPPVLAIFAAETSAKRQQATALESVPMLSPETHFHQR